MQAANCSDKRMPKNFRGPIFVELARSTKERTRQPPPNLETNANVSHPQKPSYYNATIYKFANYKLQFYNLNLQFYNLHAAVLQFTCCSFTIYMLQFYNLQAAVLQFTSCSFTISILKNRNIDPWPARHFKCTAAQKNQVVCGLHKWVIGKCLSEQSYRNVFIRQIDRVLISYDSELFRRCRVHLNRHGRKKTDATIFRHFHFLSNNPI
jgi:hypothetical protein